MSETTNDQDQQEKAIFRAALAIEDPEKRSHFIESACGEDGELWAQVDSLLAAEVDAGSFLEFAPFESQRSTRDRPVRENPGDMIGPYKLLEQIGEGGFGVVYMADQLQPIQRRVALKIIKAGMDTKQVIARFEAERQALALMDHQHIARVFDAGTTDTGRPYFVMELVRGIPVTEYCDDRSLSTEKRLRLFLDICSAVQHAHQKGIIHRDIKPSNVLVSTNGDQPVPKVIDFGIAKATQGRLTDKTLFTQFLQFIGTPAYMSPEQAQMSAVDVDTRSDIYSLGVLLYELLTGKTPLETSVLLNAGHEELCRRIREDEAPKPSTRLSALSQAERSTVAKNRRADPTQLSSELRGDVDWIVMKAVEKDRSRRYATAESLAEDIQRYLSQQPVLAAPPSLLYRLRRLARRHHRLLLAASSVAVALLLGMTIAIWQALVAQREANVARAATALASQQRDEIAEWGKKTLAAKLTTERSQQSLRRLLYVSNVRNAQRQFEQLNTARADELLQRWSPETNETTLDGEDLRGFEWRWLRTQIHQEEFSLRGHTKLLRDISFSRDGKWLVTAACDGFVRLWNMESRQEVWSYDGKSDCNGVDISPDNRYLVANFSSKTGPSSKIWDMTDPSSPRLRKQFHGGKLKYAPDGTMWSGGKQFDSGGKLLRDLTPELEQSTGQCISVDGTTLVTLDWSGRGRIVDIPSQMVFELPMHGGYADNPTKGVAISSIDNNAIVTGSESLGVCVWKRNGEKVRSLAGFSTRPAISMLSFSHDGRLLAVREYFGVIHVFDTETWQRVAIVRPRSAGNAVAFSPSDNNLLVAGGEDGTIRGWRIRSNDPVDVTMDHPAPVRLMRFTPDGRTLAVGLDDGSVWFRNVTTGDELFRTPPTWKRPTGILKAFHSFTADFIAMSPDSRFAALIGSANEVSIWDLQTQSKVATFPAETRSHPQGDYWSLEFSASGERLYAGVRMGEGEHYLQVLRWHSDAQILTMHSERATNMNRTLSLSPDGTTLARQPINTSTNLHNLPDLSQSRVLQSHIDCAGFIYLAFSPDGLQLAVGGDGVQIWNLQSGTPVVSWPRKGPFAEAVSWSDDGRRLAVSYGDYVTRLWDVETEQIAASFPGMVSAFSPDGTILATGHHGSEYADQNAAGHVTLFYAPPLTKSRPSLERN